MIFITGPLYSGKRTFARPCGQCICDVRAGYRPKSGKLADGLSAYDIVLAAGGRRRGAMDPAERARRETAGRLACLLAARADCVVQMFCGITVLKENCQRNGHFLRHGLTEYNAKENAIRASGTSRFSAAGRAMLRKADIEPKTSNTSRCAAPGRPLRSAVSLQSWWWWTA